MLVELQTEFFKLAKKPRTYIGPSALMCLLALIIVAIKYGHEFQYMQERLARDFIISGSFANAAFLTRYVLLPPVLLMFLPLFSSMVFGDLLAAEAADGTLRTLLCRPVTRIGIAVSKYLLGVFYVLTLTLGLGIAAYLLGAVFLGRGSLLSFFGGIWIIPEKAAILRLFEVYALVALGMVSTGSIAFAISTFLSNSNGAVGGAVGFITISAIIGGIEFFSSIKPYLLTTYLLSVDRLFTDKLDTALYLKSAEVFAVYAVVALIIGLIIFQKKDVLA